jgi:hypothetical protein
LQEVGLYQQRQEAGTEEFHTGAAGHLPLRYFQSVHLTLDGAHCSNG